MIIFYLFLWYLGFFYYSETFVGYCNDIGVCCIIYFLFILSCVVLIIVFVVVVVWFFLFVNVHWVLLERPQMMMMCAACWQ